ncbi:uncharacterized protein EAE97_006062 [Botrytis byssoidea]|uniref:Glucose-methanol-choline oxidoreductase N-terminal domain-containing protein n=1 Tax=Botrytis byssoidea TaxID=139641 RepID=A0A9P5M2I9_9HELO|nr:uncharacterized protein EAE97_006062 [Botrytis byssoidea]KAF7942608.1 hypothetical protein EAE97_006062 [Botrytis byssoidea]
MYSDQGEDFIYIPLFAGIGNGAIGTQYDWNLTYAPQPATNNRSIAIPLGKIVGGGSCLNKMTFDLAGKEDYDRWIEVGAVGWNELFPYFKKTRSNSRTAYWNSASNRTDLHLLTGQQVTKLITKVNNDGVAIIGVEYAAGSNFSRSTVIAAKEVILAAGAIHSPRLLQLSGIGSSPLLEQFDIETVVHLPGVGANFQDHPLLRASTTLDIYLSANNLTSNATFNAEMLALYRHNRTGPYSIEGGGAYAFIGTRSFTNTTSQIVSSASSITPASYLPSDVDSTILAGYEAQYKILTRDLASNKMPIMEFIFGGGPVFSGLQHPFSRGSVAITSADPFTSPSANPGFLTHQTDLLLLSAATKYARRIINTPIFAPLSPVETVPGPSVQTDADFEAWVRSTIGTTFHPSGTTSMMKRHYGGVVDSNYKVYGVNNLRVVDAGTFPMIQSAHLQVTVYAMAERASDAIKKS